MAFFFRVLSVFIFFIASIAMLFSVFLSSRQVQEEDFEINFFEDFTASEEWSEYFYISDRESYYTNISSNNIRKTNNENWLILDFEDSGTVLTSFYDPYKKYKIQFPWIDIHQNGIWQIYIDTESLENRYFIKPVSSIAEISFLSDDREDIYNTIHLFPWQYIIFNPARNSFYRNADIARMQILTEIWYVSEFQDHDSRLESLIWEWSTYGIYSELLSDKKTYFQSKINEVRSSNVDFYSWFTILERYFNIFFNPKKKKLYYQNRVLESYINLLTSSQYDTEKINIVRGNLRELQELDIDAYDQVSTKLMWYNSLMFRDSIANYIPTNVSLAVTEDSSNEVEGEVLFLKFYAYNISQQVNIENQSTTLTRNYIDSTFENHRDNTVALQYFSLLLQEKLLELLSNPWDSSNRYTLLYLSEYMRIASISFNRTERERKSLLYIYQDVIELLESYMRKRFFMDERTSTSLLVLNSQNNLNDTDLWSLRRNVVNLLSYYNNNDTLLDSNILRDVQLRESIREKSRLLREYLSAVWNYESYTLQYDTVSQELLWIWRDRTDASLTESDIINYLSRFQWFWLSNADLDMRDNWEVRVERISLSWRSMSFTIMPQNWNRIRDIILDWEILNFEYPLDAIEFDWQERMRTASDSDRDRYDFRRFFLNTFVDIRRDRERDILDEAINGAQEDRVISLFKRETLLGTNWELRWFENIQFAFDNIIVTRVDTSFDIFFNDIEFRLNLPEGRWGRNMEWFFTWDYVFVDWDGSFEDIRMQFYVDRERSERTIFWNNRLHLLWKINRDDFANVLDELSFHVQDIISLYNQIDSNLWFQDTSMQYNPQNKNVTIRFDFSGERNTIVFANWMIQSYIKWRNRLISEPTNPLELENYLP